MKRRYRIRRLDADRPSLFREDAPPPSPLKATLTDIAIIGLLAWLAVGLGMAWASGRLG